MRKALNQQIKKDPEVEREQQQKKLEKVSLMIGHFLGWRHRRLNIKHRNEVVVGDDDYLCRRNLKARGAGGMGGHGRHRGGGGVGEEAGVGAGEEAGRRHQIDRDHHALRPGAGGSTGGH